MSTASSKFSTRKRRFIIVSHQRSFADSMAWLVFFMLAVGFCTLHFLEQYFGKSASTCDFLDFVISANCEGKSGGTSVQAFWVIIKNSMLYTFVMMIPVYINLEVLKKYILDRKILKVYLYTPYLVAVILNALIFAGLIFLVGKAYPDMVRVKMKFWVHLVFIFSTQLISTGLLYRREVLEYMRLVDKFKSREQKIKEENLELKVKLQDVEISGAKNVLKVGTKKHYKIIPLDQITYLQGDGNEPLIFTMDGRKSRGSKSLGDYKAFLPDDQFIQVHRSYIVAKEKVLARKGNSLILEGTDVEVPISKSFENMVDSDERIGFQHEIEQFLSDLKDQT